MAQQVESTGYSSKKYLGSIPTTHNRLYLLFEGIQHPHTEKHSGKTPILWDNVYKIKINYFLKNKTVGLGIYVTCLPC